MKKGILGILVIMESFFLLLSMTVALFYDEGSWLCFLLTALSTTAIGAFCIFLSRKEENKRMRRADNFLIVSLSWIIFSIVGMVPFLCLTDMDLASAFFETMSGFTTTGATCIDEIDVLPKGLLFWRAILAPLIKQGHHLPHINQKDSLRILWLVLHCCRSVLSVGFGVSPSRPCVSSVSRSGRSVSFGVPDSVSGRP